MVCGIFGWGAVFRQQRNVRRACAAAATRPNSELRQASITVTHSTRDASVARGNASAQTRSTLTHCVVDDVTRDRIDVKTRTNLTAAIFDRAITVI